MLKPDARPSRYTAVPPERAASPRGDGLRGGYLGNDTKLGRRVLIHAFDAPAGPERERWLGLAKRAARLSHPGYLQVLDVVLSPDQGMIVLETPSEAAGDVRGGTRGGLPALVAIALTLQVGAALDDAAEHELASARVWNDALYLDGSDAVRIDPIALFADRGGESAAGADVRPVPVLCDFLESLLANRSSAGGTFDPGAQAAAGLLLRWRERLAANPHSDVHSFLGELRGIAAEASRTERPAVVVGGDGARGWATASAGGSARDEPTVELPRRVAADSTQQRAVHAGASLDADTSAYGPFGAKASRGAPLQVPRRRGAAEPAGAGERGQRTRGVVLAALMGATLVASALLVLATRASDSNEPPVNTGAATATPAAKAPLDRASLSVTAQQPAQVRVTVDGANVFNGVMQPNETRSWDGAQRVQLWTNNGKNLLVTVNNYPLGQLSAGVGHPEWNTVDWGWSTGWTPAQSALDAAPASSQPVDAKPEKQKRKDDD